MPRATVSACVDLEIANWLIEEAAKSGKTVSKVIAQALSDYMRLKTQQQASGRKVTVTQSDQKA